MFQVNPAENHIDINDGRWEQKGSSTLPSQLGASACLTPESEASGDSVTLAADAAHGLGGNPCTRKSSKAKRVKNYLKKCKNAALGNSGGGHGEEQELRTDSAVERERPEAPRVRVSRRRSGSGNRDVSSTSWYVPTDPKPPPNLVSVVEVLPPGHADEPASDNANSAVIETVSDSVCSASHPSQNDPGDVLDSRNEGGTMVVTLESQNESTPSSCLVEDDPKSLNLPSRDNQIDAVPNSHESSEVSSYYIYTIVLYMRSLIKFNASFTYRLPAGTAITHVSCSQRSTLTVNALPKLMTAHTGQCLFIYCYSHCFEIYHLNVKSTKSVLS